MKAYEAVAAALRAEGISHLFAVMGDANMSLLAALTGTTLTGTPPHGTTVFYARHEAAAVAMADGYARAGGQIGVCSVTAGPGLAATGLALMTAARRRTPLVLIAGDAAIGNDNDLQQMDQRRFAQGLGLDCRRAVRPDSVVEDLRHALDRAASRREPVVLSLPANVQDAELGDPIEGRRQAASSASWAPRIRPDDAELDRAIELVRSAHRPVIVAGRGAAEDDAGAALHALAQALGAPIFTTLPARGLVAEDGVIGLGIAGGYATAHGERVLRLADCVIAVGARLTSYTTVNGTLFANAAIVRIDRAPPAVPPRGGLAVRCYVQGSATPTVEELAKRFAASGAGPRGAWYAPAPADGRPPMPATVGSGLHPGYVMRAANAAIDPDAAIVIGVGHFSSFAVEELAAANRSFVFTHDFGSIGLGLPIGVGVTAARRTRTVVVEGDASIMMSIQELDTAVRYALPMTILVLNDEAVGAEYHKLRARGLAAESALLRSPDLAAVARGFGAEAALARTPEDVRQTLAAARQATGVFLIDFRISRDVVSALYQRRHFAGPAPARVD